jgi:hypothetical protein
MNDNHRVKGLALLLIGVATVWGAQADSWEGRLRGGGMVEVDPQTHRPVVRHRGGNTQLWNGVHEMDDGSVIIVRDGVVVPDERMLHSWSSGDQALTAEMPVHCGELVRRVCGFGDECSGTLACTTARQLLNLEQDERSGAPYGHVSASSAACKAGLADSAQFPACKASLRAGNTPCGKLVKQVCGGQGQCEKSEDCRLAGQLLDMENEERMIAKDPHARTETERQCQRAMGEKTLNACVE